MKRKWIRPIILLIILGIAYYYYRKQQSLMISNYNTAPVNFQSVDEVVKADGILVSQNEVTLNFLMPGKLTFLGIKKGDSVNKYQRLASVDAKELETAVTAAQYQYIALEAKAKEVEDNVKNHDKDESFTQATLRKSAQTARDMAYDSWLLAKRQVGDASLYSPINGVISDLTVDSAGDNVTQADTITIVNPDALYFEAQIDETDFGKIKLGLPVNLIIDAYPDTVFQGKVNYIHKVGIKTQTGGVKIFADIEFDPQDKILVTQLNGTAELILETKSALTIPNEYVLVEDNQAFVFLVSGQSVKKTPVETGKKYNNLTEILNGLSKGNYVAIQK